MSSQSIVLDCGIFLSTLLPDEPYLNQASTLLQHVKRFNLALAAPTLLRYEMSATLRKNVYRRRISVEDGKRLIQQAFAYRVTLYFSPKLAQRAYEIAEGKGLPTAYDAQYLAVAEHLGCEFWTADEKLVNSVSPTLPWVRWIGTWT